MSHWILSLSVMASLPTIQINEPFDLIKLLQACFVLIAFGAFEYFGASELAEYKKNKTRQPSC